MRWLLCLALALAACQEPAPPTASVSFGLAASLGPVDALRVELDPGGTMEIDVPAGARVFVPVAAGQATRLQLLALTGAVERWRGAVDVPALSEGARFAAEMRLEAVGRLELTVPGGIALGIDGPDHPLEPGFNSLVLRVGTYQLFFEREPLADLQIVVDHGALTRFDGAVCLRETERCNGVDDDCDGAVDEGVRNACGACGEVPVEVCNEVDDDCDGATDEGLRNACGACGPTPDEVCNGADDDCDGQTDEGLLNACGACGDTPVEVCNRADDDCDGQTDEGVRNACGACGPTPEEQCSGVDEDCDGAVDEGLRNACGECGPLDEVACDAVDEDCDGLVDESLEACDECDPRLNDCRIYESCVHALRVGATHDGVYRLRRGGAVRSVWCDQTTDGGGWSLAFNATQPIDETLGRWLPALSTLDAVDDEATVWRDLGELEGAYEVRFACRVEQGVDYDFDVVVSGLDVFTVFADEAECLEAVPTQRRDLRTGARVADDARFEPACVSPGAFLVSMDANPAAAGGSAWGTWDNQRRCGVAASRDLDGQWFVFVREVAPGRRARLHPGNEAPFGLPLLGFQTIPPEALDRYQHDVVWLDGDAATWAGAEPELLVALAAFSADGGDVVLTSDAAVVLGPDGLGWLDLSLDEPAPEAWGLTVERIGNAVDPLWGQLANPFEVAPELYDRIGVFGELGPPAAPVARPSAVDGAPMGPPVIARMRRCGGNVLLAHLRLDAEVDRGLLPLVAAMGHAAFEPTPSWLVDACPTAPVHVRQCGQFVGAVPLPTGARVSAGCAVDADVDVLLLGTGASLDDLVGLADFVAAGGRVIGSAGHSAALWMAVFGEQAVPGRRQGVCGGDLRPPVVLQGDHWFWQQNRLEPMAAPTGGCGRDGSGLPGVVPLGGWNNGTVSLGYRNHGRGRVWVVESDWPEARPLTGSAGGLLRYMMTH